MYTITHTRVPPKQSASSVPTQVLLFTKLVHHGNPSSTAPRFEACNSGESGSSLAHDECGPTEPRKRPRTCYVRRHSHEPCDLAYSPSCSKLRLGRGTGPVAFQQAGAISVHCCPSGNAKQFWVLLVVYNHEAPLDMPYIPI